MTARVLFFGVTADIAETRAVEVSVENGVSAARILEMVISQLPGLAAQKLHISLNQQYAAGDEIVGEGDELAIFTAVSGG